ncbi:N-carbamoylsarcosine amidase [Pseudonocardia sulfidoxydans NBRC 16205]|uniref:N-carbamoylsarcosine amidase n=1 Tax=Pseudonocardia sulfidoxydans NBRC 16205 TaxID=1223511 RepID=A0A511DKZ2_9PSEU|nr:isochorismatase family protein [Pseudonocardia sulfidoxydans]GEL25077.1 N-carbamoylsarcosine amidase [Pseudonocardia sulfidoxydans NBRC 16205]
MTDAVYGPGTDQTYAAAGFGEAVRRGSRPAIVVVDLTNGFTDPGYPSGADLTDVVAATTALIRHGRCAQVPVVYTTIAYTAAEADGDAVTWLTKAPGMRVLREGTPAVALDPRLPVDPRDHLVTKKGASAFFGTTLTSLLCGLHVDTVLLCGATTSGCVRATAVDAVQSGFSVLVPRECVGDRAPGPHEANLFDIQAKYGDVIDLDTATSYLQALTKGVAR